VSALEAQILFARAIVLLLLYGFITLVGWLAWAELRRHQGSPATTLPIARLVVLEGAESGWPSGTSFPVSELTVVGRDLDSGVVLADPSLSGRHAVISRDTAGWWIEDLASTNGTFVNTERASEGNPVPARSGDELSFGAVRTRFVVSMPNLPAR
jgi:hypothetical protein